MIRKVKEVDFHKVAVRFLNLGLPKDAVLFHIPNGGFRFKSEAVRLQLMGVLPGVPDLAIVYGGRIHFIELKVPGGTVSDEQADLAKRLRIAGAHVAFCLCLKDITNACERWASHFQRGSPHEPHSIDPSWLCHG